MKVPRVAQSESGPEPNRTSLERSENEDWEKVPKEWCVELVRSFPRRPLAVIAAKSALTKHYVKGLHNKCDIQVFYF